MFLSVAESCGVFLSVSECFVLFQCFRVFSSVSERYRVFVS